MIKRSWIGITFLVVIGLARGQSPDDQPLQFTDYGPVAFESFWRLPDVQFQDHWEIWTESRISNGHLPGNYFTQYFQLTAPLGLGNVLQIRTPRHFFEVPASTASQLDMARTRGNTWGDLDIVFHLQILRKWKPVASGKWSFYLTGELHTAPTNRDDRQFTDALKMLGTLTTRFKAMDNTTGTLWAIVSVGGGGWEDNIVPRQNHALKISSRLAYQLKLSDGLRGFANLGQTYLSGERTNDQGIFIYGQLGMEIGKHWQFTIGTGRMQYNETTKGHVNRWDLSVAYRFLGGSS